jgi:CubicO group peptidase (beta-lactamase class C family)
VAGKSWEELVRARFLEPLGMRDTTTSTREAGGSAPRARLRLGQGARALRAQADARPRRDRARRRDQLERARSLALGRASSSRAASSRASAWCPRPALDETWKTAQPDRARRELRPRWFLRDWNGERVVEHGGNIDGFAAEVALLPGRKTGVVDAHQRRARRRCRARSGRWCSRRCTARRRRRRQATAEDLTRFTGTYLANFFQFKNAKFVVRARDGKLSVDIPARATFELAPPDANGKRPSRSMPDADPGLVRGG